MQILIYNKAPDAWFDHVLMKGCLFEDSEKLPLEIRSDVCQMELTAPHVSQYSGQLCGVCQGFQPNHNFIVFLIKIFSTVKTFANIYFFLPLLIHSSKILHRVNITVDSWKLVDFDKTKHYPSLWGFMWQVPDLLQSRFKSRVVPRPKLTIVFCNSRKLLLTIKDGANEVWRRLCIPGNHLPMANK